MEIILGTISPLKLLGGRKDGEYKGKIVAALKEIEIQRRELEGLRGRLSERRQKLFDSTVQGGPGEEQVKGERLRQRARRGPQDHEGRRGERARPHTGDAQAAEHHGDRRRDGRT